MSASTALPAEKPRDRSIEARRAARVAKLEREKVIVDYLNRGVAIAEIAERIGLTEKRMRALVKEILARRMPEAPEEFAALQASRLNAALMVAYGAMSPGNLKAVALVVRIVREFDRYHGFADPAAGRVGRARQSVRQGAHPPTGHRARPQASARPATRPESAPQVIEKMESAPEQIAVADASVEAASRWPDNARSTPGNSVAAQSPHDAFARPTPCAGAELSNPSDKLLKSLALPRGLEPLFSP